MAERKRSNPGRSVPTQAPSAVNFETGDGPAPTRSTSDFSGSTDRKRRRGVLAPQETTGDGRKRSRSGMTQGWGKAAARVAGETGSFPTAATPPKPPPVLVLYEDLADDLVEAPEPVYGQYPRAFIKKILPWLRCHRHEILHVCSGCLPPGEGIRVDRRLAARPDILADGRNLPLRDGSIAGVLIDPPYTSHYAKELYGVDYPRPAHLLREAARVVRPGGRIGFVHYITPKPPPGTRFVKAFGLSTGFDMPIRAVTIFERDQQELWARW